MTLLVPFIILGYRAPSSGHLGLNRGELEGLGLHVSVKFALWLNLAATLEQCWDRAFPQLAGMFVFTYYSV